MDKKVTIKFKVEEKQLLYTPIDELKEHVTKLAWNAVVDTAIDIINKRDKSNAE